MNAIIATPEIAYAVGVDAGNASMRKSGRTVWNEDDRDACVDASLKIWALIDAGMVADMQAMHEAQNNSKEVGQ